MKIAVIGANGQLGSDTVKEFENENDEVVGLTHNDIEIADRENCIETIKNKEPDVIVNTAAYHNVEKCENNPEEAFHINGVGARNLAYAANEVDALIIQIGTDYVFSGKKAAPYIETDVCDPLNVYGNTKLSGDLFVESIAEKYLCMRSCGLYGKNPCRAKGGMNFVELMLKLANERDEVRVVDNEVLTPTSTHDLAKQIVRASRTNEYGICHATAEGECSWFDFAKAIFEIADVDVELNVASPEEFPVKIPRPAYSVLENKFLKDNEMNVLRQWREGLEGYLLKERVEEKSV